MLLNFIYIILMVIFIMKENKERIDVVKNESGLYNVNIDCNSKEGKLLIEVVEKESTLKNKSQ